MPRAVFLMPGGAGCVTPVLLTTANTTHGLDQQRAVLLMPGRAPIARHTHVQLWCIRVCVCVCVVVVGGGVSVWCARPRACEGAHDELCACARAQAVSDPGVGRVGDTELEKLCKCLRFVLY